MWVREDYKGNKVIWYSEQEYKILRQENEEAREIIAELDYECKGLREKINKLEND